ncbi:MAG TPA: hypothetical protein VL096_22360, partial [Pirellulaceae bacterium]|nr:hypothetical protein [Pirellulaceae bacterium]
AYNDARPAPPIGYQMSDYSEGLWGFDRMRMYRNYYSNNMTSHLAPTFASSIMEVEMRRAAQPGGQQLEPGTYLVQLERAPEMPSGYSRARERGSFHLLEGRW